MKHYADLSGQIFNRLTVLGKGANNKHGNVMWDCVCTCETLKTACRHDLTSGRVKSCGCLLKETAAERGRASFKHGLWDTIEYHSWRGMKARCTNPNEPSYNHYGGRGITVCESWLTSFEQFLSDMGNCPAGYSIDRIDNSGNYEPSNCRWTDNLTQGRNRRSNHMVTYNGDTLAMSAMAEKHGISRTTLRDRLQRGWTIHDAITKPVRQFKSHP